MWKSGADFALNLDVKLYVFCVNICAAALNMYIDSFILKGIKLLSKEEVIQRFQPENLLLPMKSYHSSDSSENYLPCLKQLTSDDFQWLFPRNLLPKLILGGNSARIIRNSFFL